MTEDRAMLREVAWQEVFPALRLIAALRLAFTVRSLVLVLLAMTLTALGWAAIDSVFPNADDQRSEDRLPPGWFIESPDSASDFVRNWLGAPNVRQVFPPDVPPALAARADVPTFYSAWHRLSQPFVAIFHEGISLVEFTHLLLAGLWALAVWALFGGAITRMAAVSLAAEEQPSFRQLLGYALSKWTAYFSAPLCPLIGAMLFALPFALLGLLVRTGGAMVAAIVWPLVIAGGLLMAVLLVGLYFGWPLMWATISAEGTDSFDALSRSYAYTYQRPLHYLGYAFIAFLLGVVGWLLVSIFADSVVELSRWSISWGAGSGWLTKLDGTFAFKLIRFWERCILAVPTAFVLGFFWSGATTIYFLLRRQVDATDLDEVYLGVENEPYGLPPLETDAAGVPGVADDGDGEATVPESGENA